MLPYVLFMGYSVGVKLTSTLLPASGKDANSFCRFSICTKYCHITGRSPSTINILFPYVATCLLVCTYNPLLSRTSLLASDSFMIFIGGSACCVFQNNRLCFVPVSLSYIKKK